MNKHRIITLMIIIAVWIALSLLLAWADPTMTLGQIWKDFLFVGFFFTLPTLTVLKR